MNLKEILKKFAEEMGETIIDGWDESEENYNAWTDEEHTWAAYDTVDGLVIDTFDGHLESQEIVNANIMTSFTHDGTEFKEFH